MNQKQFSIYTPELITCAKQQLTEVKLFFNPRHYVLGIF